MASARNRHSTATTAYTASDSAADGTNDTNASPARGMTKVVSQVEINPNTNWMSQQPGVWAFYVLILLLIYLMFAMVDPKDAWTLTSTVHFLITFYLFHWHKGTPLEFGAAGEYDHLTYWEQMDSEQVLTPNKKFFTVVPVVLFMLASHSTNYEKPLLYVNLSMTLTLVAAKLPSMHKVRILGINKD